MSLYSKWVDSFTIYIYSKCPQLQFVFWKYFQYTELRSGGEAATSWTKWPIFKLWVTGPAEKVGVDIVNGTRFSS